MTENWILIAKRKKLQFKGIPLTGLAFTGYFSFLTEERLVEVIKEDERENHRFNPLCQFNEI
jgi:hypothetical protein